jgi:hypothetical protein
VNEYQDYCNANFGPDDVIDAETERAIERAMQFQRARPHIGPLLDRWEHMSNDVKGSLRAGDDYFYELMEAFKDAWIQP